jgi:short-subunit dehydrogenase
VEKAAENNITTTTSMEAVASRLRDPAHPAPYLLLAALLLPPLLRFIATCAKSLDLQNKHVLVTGASRGLGRALAVELAVKHKARVTLVARGKEELLLVRQEIEKAGGVAAVVQCDVTAYDKVAEACARAEAGFGPVDCLMCCAGQALTGRFVDRAVQDFESQMKLNYLGSAYFCKVLVPGMMARQQGRVVLCTSQAAFMSCVGYAAYSPSKFALRGLGEALRNELLPYDINVHILFPGNMRTPGFEAEQLTKPEETKVIESGEALQEPADVSRACLDSIRKGEFMIYGGNLSGYLMGRMSQGIAPRSSFLLDLLLSPFLVVVGWGIRVFVIDRAAKQGGRRSAAG